MSPRIFSLSLVVAVVLALPVFLLSSYRLGLLALVATYTIASLAQNLLAGYGDVPSLGNVTFFAISAYTAASLLTLAHLPAIVALPAGVLAAGILGLVVGLPALRISGMHLAIVTVALVFAAQELMQQWDAAHAPGGLSVNAPTWLLQERGLYITAVLLAILSYLAVWNMLRARSGRALLALSSNPYAAMAAGISPMRYRLAAFVLSGLLTGLAGIVYLYYLHTITPGAFPLELSLAFLTMMILGGSRSLGGSLLGALIVGLLPQLLAAFSFQIGQLSAQSAGPGIYALLLLVVLRFFPQGLWNVIAPWFQRLLAGSTKEA